MTDYVPGTCAASRNIVNLKHRPPYAKVCDWARSGAGNMFAVISSSAVHNATEQHLHAPQYVRRRDMADVIVRGTHSRHGVSLRGLIASVFLSLYWPAVVVGGCEATGVHVQVLGAVSARTQEEPPSSSYLIWLNGKGRVLVNAGADSATSFTATGAHVTDLDVILFTQLDVANTGDLPWLIQLSLPEKRSRPLPIYGPDRSKLMPSTVTFVRTLFDSKRGVYRYLGELLNPLGRRTYKLQPQDILPKRRADATVYSNNRLLVTTSTLVREPLPALAWRIEAAKKTIVFSGDRVENLKSLEQLVSKADLLIITRSIDGAAGSPVQALTAPVFANMANHFGVRKLAFTDQRSPQSRSTLDRQTLLNTHYRGPISFVAPMDCLSP